MAKPTPIELLEKGQNGREEWNCRLENGEPIPSLRSISLRNKNLRNFKLRGVDFSLAQLRNVNLSGADMRDANLKEATIQNCNLKCADLTNAQLLKTQFHHVQLDGATLRRADFNRATARDVDFGSNSDLTGADLTCARFENGKLQNATFHAPLDSTIFIQIDLSGCDFGHCKLSNVGFSDTNLHKASFQGAQLSLVSFRGANLTSTCFRSSTLEETTFQQSDLRSADFTKCTFDCGSLVDSKCESAIFISTKGLHGPKRLTTSQLAGDSLAIYRKSWDLPTWSYIRTVGSLPLFGVSYLGIISIVLWIQFVDLGNGYLRLIRESSLPGIPDWLRTAPDVPLTNTVAWTLVALIALALATTSYKLGCPSEIQESSDPSSTVRFSNLL